MEEGAGQFSQDYWNKTWLKPHKSPFPVHRRPLSFLRSKTPTSHLQSLYYLTVLFMFDTGRINRSISTALARPRSVERKVGCCFFGGIWRFFAAMVKLSLPTPRQGSSAHMKNFFVINRPWVYRFTMNEFGHCPGFGVGAGDFLKNDFKEKKKIIMKEVLLSCFSKGVDQAMHAIIYFVLKLCTIFESMAS